MTLLGEEELSNRD